MDVTAEDLVSELSMYTADKPFLLVEGDDDYNFFVSKQYPRNMYIVPAGGCENVVESIEIIEKEGKFKALGVIDRDYRHCFGKLPKSANIVVTDKRDLDAMFFLSDDTFNKVLVGRISKEKVEKLGCKIIDIRKEVIDSAKILGKLRMFSEGKEHHFSFQKIDFDKFIDSKDVTLDVKALIAHLQGIHKNNTAIAITDIADADAYVKGITALSNEIDSCCGHDLMSILAIGLRKKWGTHSGKEMTRGVIEELFRLAYPDPEYETTTLYKGIIGWIHARIAEEAGAV